MLDWLYPNTCRLCGAASGQTTLCDTCRAALPRVPRPICLHCGAPVSGQQLNPYVCPACAGEKQWFDIARSALAQSAEAMQLVHDLKYHHAAHMARALAPMLAELWQNTPALNDGTQRTLIPVPVTTARLFERGYNQTYELARELARYTGSKIAEPLLRHKTKHGSQTKLSARERAKNAAEAYSLHPAWESGKKSLAPHLVLVDDVFTTGATVRSCAKLLKKVAGVESVAVLTLLRIGS